MDSQSNSAGECFSLHTSGKDKLFLLLDAQDITRKLTIKILFAIFLCTSCTLYSVLNFDILLLNEFMVFCS